MKAAAEFAICYDISNDAERARVDRFLKGFGFRVQKSVFECRLTRSGKVAVVDGLRRMDLRSGSVKIYRIYGGSASVVVGQPMANPDAGFAFSL